MDTNEIGGIAVWIFELAHIQVPVHTLRLDDQVDAFITDMMHPTNKLCILIKRAGEVIGFPPDLLEADIIRSIESMAAKQDLSGCVLRGRVVSIAEDGVTVALGLDCK